MKPIGAASVSPGLWLVWEAECPGEGSTLIAGPSLAYAKAVYWVGCGEAFEADPVPLDGCAATAEMLEIRGETPDDAVILGHSDGWFATVEELARVLELEART